MAKKRPVKIYFDFYEVIDYSTPIEKTLKDLLALKPHETQTGIGDEEVRLEDFDYNSTTNHFKASFVRLRPMEKIGIYNRTGGKREIPLKDDEYVGEEVSFYFDPTMKLLVLQRNKYGVSSTGVETYFQHFTSNNNLKIVPLFTLDTYKKLLSQKVITYIETDISIPATGILDGETEGWAFGDVKKLKDQLGALKIGVTLTVEDSKKSKLDFKTAAKLIKELRANKHTNKLIAKVRKNDGGKLEQLNLFQDLVRVTFNRSLEYGKTYSTIAMQEMAETAYIEKKAEVQQLLLAKQR